MIIIILASQNINILQNRKASFTTFSEEYPQNYDKTVPGKDIPFYPIPTKSNPPKTSKKYIKRHQ